MNLDLLGIIKERGLLLDKEIFEALSSINDIFTIRKLLDNFEQVSGQKMITRSNLIKNWVFSKKISEDLIEGIQPKFLKIFIQLGIQINVEDIPVNIKKVEESKLK